MRKTVKSTLPIIHTLIRDGKIRLAKREILGLVDKEFSNEDAAPFAALARRADLPFTGIRILNPRVRSTTAKPVHPTPEERLEYAACLVYVGAWTEGRAILETLDAKKYPRVSLTLAFALMNQWDYAAAIALLIKYVRHPALDDYSRLVGKANLADAYLYERQFHKATAILRELSHASGVHKNTLMLGKTMELSALNFLLQGDLERADAFLTRALDELAGDDGLTEFFVRKWRAILELARSGGNAKSITALKRVRAEAAERRHWESIRSCDRFEAVARKDESLLLKVCFGTPYETFRRQTLDDFGQNSPLPKAYDWQIFPGKRPGPLLDLTSHISSRDGLKPGQQLHQLLVILCSDLYRPFSIPQLYTELHPGEFYHPTHSAAKVHASIGRLRKWASSSKFPLHFVEQDGFFRIQATAPCVIRISRARPESQSLYGLAKLREAYPMQEFTASQAKQALGGAARTTIRLLTEGTRLGLLRRVGAGRATRYCFCQNY